MKKLHTKFQKELTKSLEAEGRLTLNVHGSAWQASGWPDFQCYWKGRSTHVEVKIDNDPVSDTQWKVIRELRKRGIAAVVVRLWSKTSAVTFDGVEGASWTRKECAQRFGPILDAVVAGCNTRNEASK